MITIERTRCVVFFQCGGRPGTRNETPPLVRGAGPTTHRVRLKKHDSAAVFTIGPRWRKQDLFYRSDEFAVGVLRQFFTREHILLDSNLCRIENQSQVAGCFVLSPADLLLHLITQLCTALD